MKFNANSLPNDPEQLKQMLLELQQRMDKELAQKDNELVEKDAAYQQLLERYNLKLANEYGKKSEKMPGADEVFNEAESVLDDVDKKILADSNINVITKTKPKRKPLPASLPRKEVLVDIDESDKVCDCCQSPLHKMGESSSEALEFVPAHIKVIKTIRPKYTCRQCERNGTESVVKTALMPATPIPKSIATPSLLSQIISCKYQFGLPLYRQETMFSDIGLELSRQTMSSWMLRSAQLLEPLYMRLKEVLLAEPAIFADETPLKVINAEKATSYMWVYCCGSDRLSEKTNIVLYDYHNSRAAQCAIDFLDGYQGYMHVDGYQAYGLTEARLVACLAHIRRKFMDAKKIQAKSRTGKVDVALNLIGKLYGLEQQLKDKSIEDRFNIRQSHAKPIVKELHDWLINHKDKIPPKSKLGEAISYSLNQFDKFQRYLEDGRLSIDNNRAERAIKPFVIGRKAWLFSNTCNGAHASAILYSIVETAKANGIVVHDYISQCLQHIAEQPNNLEPLLPWNIQRG
ncbi:IS66 family transposase [Colwellia hornerae]|uniref:IS66 family transposase n=1 Tax=Colwellia hornerae TaxID=89402 RepID=A0A5C6Q221_9GAMM|nr:IS66 family transposase [Colwellia hornerae]TWX45085.1 IS66 family transposase [Colwellia hornerae]TWX53238.1 IS66 family transposase [Colwellia hornerae]TWX62450.1 IS66 family transposase [Colwellia hornerae]